MNVQTCSDNLLVEVAIRFISSYLLHSLHGTLLERVKIGVTSSDCVFGDSSTLAGRKRKLLSLDPAIVFDEEFNVCVVPL